MAEMTLPRLVDPSELPVAETYRGQGTSRCLLVCEHASSYIPRALNNLGVDPSVARKHVGWDIGALALAKYLADALDAQLIHARISRLVFDCNRTPAAPDAMPETSEVYDIPGNRDLSDADRALRTNEVYHPFHDAVAAALDARAEPPVLITVHSFTPVYFGKPREVELGILHGRDDRLARLVLGEARKATSLRTELNQPYSAADGVMHMIERHGTDRGIPNVMLEVRNDLIDSDDSVDAIGCQLAPVLQSAIEAGLGQSTKDTAS